MKLMDNSKGNFIHNLFATKPSTTEDNTEKAQEAQLQAGSHARQEGETYHQYGFRIAGLSAGNSYTLLPSLQSVYYGIRKEQEKDVALQEELQKELNLKKATLEAERQKKAAALEDSHEKQDKLTEEIETLKKELAALQQGTKERNSNAWITFIISSVLLVPFSIYFFIFYSSVAYSAFFKDFTANITDNLVAQATFDGNAISQAWNAGFAELLFVLLMPIIFLAFGFVLNRWEKETGKLKYLKIPLLITVAFIFDALLSYGICKKIYAIFAMMQLGDVAPYSPSLAIIDPDFWIIICLGFVSYLIWGFVFGFWVDAWESLDLNPEKRKLVEGKIEDAKQRLDAEHKNCLQLKSEITGIEPKMKEVDAQMNTRVRIDIGKIKLELNNFFAGWQQYLAAANKTNVEKQEATHIFNEMINVLSQN